MEFNEKHSKKKAQNLYILEAALEYFISILVTGSFLAALTGQMGMSDGMTGILSSVISLGCLAQLLSVFFRRRRVKPFVIILSILNQLLFAALYLIPLSKGDTGVRTAMAAGLILTAYILYYFVHPKKISWLMSLVPDEKRGLFTAHKEIFSLITGTVFTFLMSALMDAFLDAGRVRAAFGLTALVMLIIMLLHTFCLVYVPEKQTEAGPAKNLGTGLKELAANPNMRRVTVLFILYNIAVCLSTPFYGTYLISELGFSLKFVSVLLMVSSISRILFSRFWGNYADRHSFASMLFYCFGLLAAAFLFAGLAAPCCGAMMFTLYYICFGIAQGGVNSALVNLIFDYMPPENRADSLAVCQAASGTAGFAATLLVSPFIAWMQNQQSCLLGITVYAQQILSFGGLLFIVAGMMFIRKKLLAGGRR